MAAMLLVTPGIFAAYYYFKIRRESIRSLEFFAWTSIYIFLINMFVLSVAYLNGYKGVQSSELFSVVGNAVKYGALAAIASLAFPNILFFTGNLFKGKKE